MKKYDEIYKEELERKKKRELDNLTKSQNILKNKDKEFEKFREAADRKKIRRLLGTDDDE
jgi:flagellar biosynthesis regulator FlaF